MTSTRGPTDEVPVATTAPHSVRARTEWYPTSRSPPASGSGTSSSNTVIIAVVVSVSGALLIVLVAIAFFLWRRKARRSTKGSNEKFRRGLFSRRTAGESKDLKYETPVLHLGSFENGGLDEEYNLPRSSAVRSVKPIVRPNVYHDVPAAGKSKLDLEDVPVRPSSFQPAPMFGLGKDMEEVRLGVSFKILEPWSDTLLDRESGNFKNLKSHVEDSVREVHEECTDFRGVRLLQFRQGSIIADIHMLFICNAAHPLDTIKKAISSGKLSSLKVDRKYYEERPVPVEAEDKMFYPLFATSQAPPSVHLDESSAPGSSESESSNNAESVPHRPRAVLGHGFRESGYISENELTLEPPVFPGQVRDSIKSSESRDSCMSDETAASQSPRHASAMDLSMSDDSGKGHRGSHESVSKKAGLLSQVFHRGKHKEGRSSEKRADSRPHSIHSELGQDQATSEGIPHLALYNFYPQDYRELALVQGEQVYLTYTDHAGWAKVFNRSGKKGWVPQNFIAKVTPAQLADTRAAVEAVLHFDSVIEPYQLEATSPSSPVASHKPVITRQARLGSASAVDLDNVDGAEYAQDHLFVVIFPYEAQEESELSLEIGDVVTLLRTSESGWWKGKLLKSAETGWFPRSYVKPQSSSFQLSEYLHEGDDEQGTVSDSEVQTRSSASFKENFRTAASGYRSEDNCTRALGEPEESERKKSTRGKDRNKQAAKNADDGSLKIAATAVSGASGCDTVFSERQDPSVNLNLTGSPAEVLKSSLSRGTDDGIHRVQPLSRDDSSISRAGERPEKPRRISAIQIPKSLSHEDDTSDGHAETALSSSTSAISANKVANEEHLSQGHTLTVPVNLAEPPSKPVPPPPRRRHLVTMIAQGKLGSSESLRALSTENLAISHGEGSLKRPRRNSEASSPSGDFEISSVLRRTSANRAVARGRPRSFQEYHKQHLLHLSDRLFMKPAWSFPSLNMGGEGEQVRLSPDDDRPFLEPIPRRAKRNSLPELESPSKETATSSMAKTGDLVKVSEKTNGVNKASDAVSSADAVVSVQAEDASLRLTASSSCATVTAVLSKRRPVLLPSDVESSCESSSSPGETVHTLLADEEEKSELSNATGQPEEATTKEKFALVKPVIAAKPFALSAMSREASPTAGVIAESGLVSQLLREFVDQGAGIRPALRRSDIAPDDGENEEVAGKSDFQSRSSSRELLKQPAIQGHFSSTHFVLTSAKAPSVIESSRASYEQSNSPPRHSPRRYDTGHNHVRQLSDPKRYVLARSENIIPEEQEQDNKYFPLSRSEDGLASACGERPVRREERVPTVQSDPWMTASSECGIAGPVPSFNSGENETVFRVAVNSTELASSVVKSKSRSLPTSVFFTEQSKSSRPRFDASSAFFKKPRLYSGADMNSIASFSSDGVVPSSPPKRHTELSPISESASLSRHAVHVAVAKNQASYSESSLPDAVTYDREPVPAPRKRTSAAHPSPDAGDSPSTTAKQHKTHNLSADDRASSLLSLSSVDSSRSSASSRPERMNLRRAVMNVYGQSEYDLSFQAGASLYELRPRNRQGLCYGLLENGAQGWYPEESVVPFFDVV